MLNPSLEKDLVVMLKVTVKEYQVEKKIEVKDERNSVRQIKKNNFFN